MTSAFPRFQGAAARFAALSFPLLWLIVFAAVALSHLTLLRLPFFWDEGGYYIPAALDFFHHGSLIPVFTNAHPPLPNVLLGALWRVTGFGILQTRLAVCAVTAAALLAIFRLANRLLDAPAALATTLLTAVYPIWFAQSTLAHADIFAAGLILWALAIYLPAQAAPALSIIPAQASQPNRPNQPNQPSPRHPQALTLVFFSLAALAKETSIVYPLTLAAVQTALLLRDPTDFATRRIRLRWIATLLFPLLPLAAWFAFHRFRTGFTFGNPEFLRYNATANLTLSHFGTALLYRFVHLTFQRNFWIPLVLAVGCLLLLPRREALPNTSSPAQIVGLPTPILRDFTALFLANWIAFSILGGALLTRYLLPIYPLLLLTCVAIWRIRTSLWPALTALTAAVFLSALWLNPRTFFAPEDNLTYRDMILVHQQAIDFTRQHFPGATVLTAWPVSADLNRPDLGYTPEPFKTTSIDNFTLPQILHAAQNPGRFDTAIVFTTHFVSPAFRRWLDTHPTAQRTRQWQQVRDLDPAEIAALLGGRVVWQGDLHGEWAAVLRFNRTYVARTAPPTPPHAPRDSRPR